MTACTVNEYAHHVDSGIKNPQHLLIGRFRGTTDRVEDGRRIDITSRQRPGMAGAYWPIAHQHPPPRSRSRLPILANGLLEIVWIVDTDARIMGTTDTRRLIKILAADETIAGRIF